MREARAAVAEYSGPYEDEIRQALANNRVGTAIFPYYVPAG
jgi:hypothetical protein